MHVTKYVCMLMTYEPGQILIFDVGTRAVTASHYVITVPEPPRSSTINNIPF